MSMEVASAITISYRKNPGYQEGNPNSPRLYARINLSGHGVDQLVTDLPITFRNLEAPVGPIRVVYSTMVAGLPVERGNLESLAAVLDGFLAALIRFERLPLYMFNVADSAWPIYQLPDHAGAPKTAPQARTRLVTRYPGGPVFSAGSISELWLELADHFKRVGRIASRRDLHILYLSPRDLQLYAPYFTLRAPHIPDMPVFAVQGDNGAHLLAEVGDERLMVPLSDGHEVFVLYHAAAHLLASQGVVVDPYSLTIRRLPSARWDAVRTILKPHSQGLLYYGESTNSKLARKQVPIYRLAATSTATSTAQVPVAEMITARAKDSPYRPHPSLHWPISLVAAHERRPGYVTVYLASDSATLQQRMGEELTSQGIINSPGTLFAASLPATRGTARQSGGMSILDQLLAKPQAGGLGRVPD